MSARAAEEFRALKGSLNRSSIVSKGWLTYFVVHAVNLVSTATGGRYRLALLRDEEEVRPLDLRDDDMIETFDAEDVVA